MRQAIREAQILWLEIMPEQLEIYRSVSQGEMSPAEAIEEMGGIGEMSFESRRRQDLELLHGKKAEDLEPTISTGAKEEFGFPADPSLPQLKCWENQERVLSALQRTGTMHSAAIAAGLSPWAPDRWIRTDVYGFKKRRAMAIQVYEDMLDAEIDRRGVEGIDKPIYYKGEKVDTVKEYSDNLLMFRRKKLDPAYRDNYAPPVNPQDIKVTSIVYNLHPSVAPPPAPEPVTDAEYLELPAGVDGTRARRTLPQRRRDPIASPPS